MNSVCIEGWRDINHSYALVNQWQLLELVKLPLILRHNDVPYYNPNWNKTTNSNGFSVAQNHIIQSIKKPTSGEKFDISYRISFPLNLDYCSSSQLFLFGTSENQNTDGMFVNGSPREANKENRLAIITPSKWSKKGFIQAGFNSDKVFVVPHGIDLEKFPVIDEGKRLSYRKNFSFRKTDFVLLSVGSMTYNKGIDVLIIAYALLKQKYNNIKLILKDQSNLYNLSGSAVVKEVKQSKYGYLLNEACLSDLFIVSSNLSIDQLHGLYGSSDCYVSPYRAEGFNLPPLEAAASGVPIVVTRGGSTDDYFDPLVGSQIDSKLVRTTSNKSPHYHLEPNLESLVFEITQIIDGKRDCGGVMGSEYVHNNYSWNNITKKLVALFDN